MSYCVNCGVELDASASECPLCNTPVINPKELEKIARARRPFPTERGQVETVKRKDLGILVSTVVLATAATCGVLNALVFQESPWSLAVIGACIILWVIMIPAVIYTKQPVYVSLLYDGGAVGLYLFMLQCHLDKGERNVRHFPQRANGQRKMEMPGRIRDIFHQASLRME